MRKRSTIFAAVALLGLLLVCGSLKTIHATTEHSCARHAIDGHPTVCKGHVGASYKAIVTNRLSDDGLPTWPACSSCPPPTCFCPWDSWTCFFSSSADPHQKPLYKQVFTRHAAQQLLTHGLFYTAA